MTPEEAASVRELVHLVARRVAVDYFMFANGVDTLSGEPDAEVVSSEGAEMLDQCHLNLAAWELRPADQAGEPLLLMCFGEPGEVHRIAARVPRRLSSLAVEIFGRR